MTKQPEFIVGEYSRKLDERYRLSIPTELVTPFAGKRLECMLAKERLGCLSLWHADDWQSTLDQDIGLVKAKMQAGRLAGRLQEVQRLGRLLSSRHRSTTITERGRLMIPEGFREFLRVEPGGDVFVVGAAVCIEIWNPELWLKYLEGRMPRFHQLLNRLSE